MKAIIMAGGEGRRLRAVSGGAPKPLVPLCGRPVMEHIVLLLRKSGITDICAALKYRAGDIMAHFGDGSAFGVKMSYSIEENALGTAGGVKNCRDFYGNEDFLVISGDAACDLDLASLIEAHEANSPAVTIALYPHPEPLRYGLAVCGEDGCVRSFIEKPDWPRVVTNLVNTGIYVISPRAMDFVPENTEFDFAKDLFPLLMERGEKLYGQVLEGYWCDIGTPASYYSCCVDALSGRLKLDMAGGFEPEKSEPVHDGGDDGEALPCGDRAGLMARLSGFFLGMGADLSDGIVFTGSDCEIRIRPAADIAALRLSVSADDAELARELTLSSAELIKKLDKSTGD